VLYSLGATAVVVMISIFACFPDLKFSQAVSKKLKKFFPNGVEPVEETEV
jgi:hypothetical protein